MPAPARSARAARRGSSATGARAGEEQGPVGVQARDALPAPTGCRLDERPEPLEALADLTEERLGGALGFVCGHLDAFPGILYDGFGGIGHFLGRLLREPAPELHLGLELAPAAIECVPLVLDLLLSEVELDAQRIAPLFELVERKRCVDPVRSLRSV